MLGKDGRVTGDAYVVFATETDLNEALKRDKQRLGHRYIELFKCDAVYECNNEVFELTICDRAAKHGLYAFVAPPGTRSLSPPAATYPREYDRYPRADYHMNPSSDVHAVNAQLLDQLYSAAAHLQGLQPMPRQLPYPPISDPYAASYAHPMPAQTYVIRMRGVPYGSSTQDIAAFFRPIHLLNIQLVCDMTSVKLISSL